MLRSGCVSFATYSLLDTALKKQKQILIVITLQRSKTQCVVYLETTTGVEHDRGADEQEKEEERADADEIEQGRYADEESSGWVDGRVQDLPVARAEETVVLVGVADRHAQVGEEHVAGVVEDAGLPEREVALFGGLVGGGQPRVREHDDVDDDEAEGEDAPEDCDGAGVAHVGEVEGVEFGRGNGLHLWP